MAAFTMGFGKTASSDLNHEEARSLRRWQLRPLRISPRGMAVGRSGRAREITAVSSRQTRITARLSANTSNP